MVNASSNTSLSSSSSSSSSSQPPLNGLKERIDQFAIEAFKEIVRLNYEAMTTYSQTNVKVLGKGCFYPNEYCTALTKANQVARLNWFKERGSFYHGFASPKHFTHGTNELLPFGKETCSFHLKAGVDPSDALNAILEGPSLIDCQGAYEIAYFKAIENELGKDKFNTLFRVGSAAPFGIKTNNVSEPGKTDVNCSPFNFLSKRTVNIKSLTQVQKGQVINISGPTQYTPKHEFGEDKGINVMCIDDTLGLEKFIGLGTSPEGLSFKEVCELLLAAYNKAPIKAEDILSKEGAEKATTHYIDRIVKHIINKVSINCILDFIKECGSDLANKEVDLADEQALAKLFIESRCAKFHSEQFTLIDFYNNKGGTIEGRIELNYEMIAELKGKSPEEGKKIIEALKNKHMKQHNSRK